MSISNTSWLAEIQTRLQNGTITQVGLSVADAERILALAAKNG